MKGVAAIMVAEGTENVKVNTVIAVLAADGEDASSAASGGIVAASLRWRTVIQRHRRCRRW
jgi:pyruvate/2-oxoglutarate dehydrogenase complex dihydrolipoamide acyltransferase (E2) component